MRGQERTRPIGLSWAGGIRWYRPRRHPHRMERGWCQRDDLSLFDPTLEAVHTGDSSTTSRPSTSTAAPLGRDPGALSPMASTIWSQASDVPARRGPGGASCQCRGHALSGRADQLRCSPLRGAPTQHRASPGPARPRGHVPHHRQAYRLAESMVPGPGRPYPLSLLVESYCPSRSTSTGQ